MNLTPAELLELKLLALRIESESEERARKGTLGHCMTDRARESTRVLPVLRKIISMVGET